MFETRISTSCKLIVGLLLIVVGLGAPGAAEEGLEEPEGARPRTSIPRTIRRRGSRYPISALMPAGSMVVSPCWERPRIR